MLFAPAVAFRRDRVAQEPGGVLQPGHVEIVLCDDGARIVKGAVSELGVIAQACGDLVGIHASSGPWQGPCGREQSLLNFPDGDGEDRSELVAARDGELLVDGLQVVVHRAARDAELGRDVPCLQPPGGEEGDLAFTRRER